MAQPKARSQYRVERPKALEVHDDNGHLWAVSYADLLMVLLSFFILFFSSDANKQDIIRKLLPLSSLTEGNAQTGTQPAGTDSMNISTEIKSISGLKVEQLADPSVLSIQFPENIFSVGSADLSTEQKRQLQTLFSKLQPYLSRLQVEIVGHTDSEPLVRKKSKYMQDNLDLSFFRASQALRFVLGQKELAFAQISAKGAGSQILANRTLSITIRPKGYQP
ncbi:MAG: OmpA/MotB family protein [Pseudobdellovibrionaceae bacterium]